MTKLQTTLCVSLVYNYTTIIIIISVKSMSEKIL